MTVMASRGGLAIDLLNLKQRIVGTAEFSKSMFTTFEISHELYDEGEHWQNLSKPVL